MKAWLRLAMAAFILAALVTVPTTAQQQIDEPPCVQLCMLALCPQPQTCGPFTDANGQPACGCHDSYGEVV